jgi:two-component system phosphate regulon sensor histidine kinase PhoR
MPTRSRAGGLGAGGGTGQTRGMADAFDTVRFFHSMTDLLDGFIGGDPGLAMLQRATDLGLWTLEATGIAVVEFGPAAGRVVTAAGAAVTALGRRIDTRDPRATALIRGPRITVLRPQDLPLELAEICPAVEILVGVVTRIDMPIGLVLAYVPEGNADTPHRRGAFTYVTLLASRAYVDGRGLPVHADPAIRTAVDATLIVGPDGTVGWVNPRHRDVLDAAGIVSGAPIPLPLPGAGQVVEHDTLHGRWLRITARHQPDGDGVEVTVRDISEARRWEQSRELFVALTSHELRTPVTVIRGYADTLNDRWDALDEAGRRLAAKVLCQRAGELARLLDRLLSAVGEPGVPPVVSRFDLLAAVGAAIGTLPADLRARVCLDESTVLPPVFGEQASIISIVSELVTNAGKYVTDPGATIDIDGVHDARTVGFRVSDRGIGVRPEHVESAFERFWQADTGDHRRYGGVGLGLYLVRRIVERQNGWVSLRPREGGGTIAEVRLPRGDIQPAQRQVGEA